MKLAVVVPARNAEHLLVECLAAILRQSRPADEVLLVIGPSDDRTMEVANGLAGPQVHVLHNPAGDRGSALNIALAWTDADLVAFVDAQAGIAPDYLAQAVSSLAETDAAAVGGPMRPLGRTPIGRAMALALQSAFGSGGSQFHFEGEAREVESVYLGVYRSSAFERVGWYNPALLRTEDDDLNWRMRAARLVIWLDPAIRSTYFCRDSLAGVWRQYHGYGHWKVALATLRPGAIRLRHTVPAAFVVALLAAAVVSVVWLWLALPLLLALYLAAAFAAVRRAADGGLSERLLYPLVTLTMHLAYGFGTLRGLLGWFSLRRRAREGVRRAAEAQAAAGDGGRDAELQRIRNTYQRYDSEDRARLWDPRNRGYARMIADRELRLVGLLREGLPPTGGAVLDLGCGTGELAESARAGGIGVTWTGVDLREEMVRQAAAAYPWATFVEASADALPFADGSFDVVIASTLFSSLPSPALEHAAAAEVTRILRPGGWMVWYDLRYDNPRNPAVHGLSEERLRRLFPGWDAELTPMTLLPPLARRLGPATSLLYPLLDALPPLRSHLVGRLRRPSP
jgi:SAM-dependent methyltransferase/GT2 family glycosyltransferase